ncbi:MAG: hypothetical protein F6K55_00065 [Moorea sp. SIO4A3]|nr:hypothetical protein [Moorena sp. SIO4A3]
MRLTFGHATRSHSIPIMPLQLIGRTGIKPVCWGHQAWNWHLERETEAWYIERNRLHKSVDWQFTTADARVRLKRLYPQIQN